MKPTSSPALRTAAFLALLCILSTTQGASAARTANPQVIASATYNGHTYHLLQEASWADSQAAAVTEKIV